MELTSIKRRSAADEVHDQLLKQLVAGAQPPGSRLPSERKLAEVLGVSRPVVREAIQRLVASGHLDVRQGDGAVVNDITRTGGLDLLPYLLVDAPDGAMVNPSVVRSVLEVREYLGPWIAERAAARSGSKLAEPLARALADIERAQSGQTQQLAALDFWDCLVTGADSIAMTLIFNGMRRVYEPMLAAVADAVAAAEPVAGYRKLAEAVTSGAALKARRAASTVLGGATAVLTEFLDQMEAQ
ncbi:FadR/GntR family transcriptional regulator [Mycolicibacterium mucogenicum]|uniref:FadR family transcriptional regulator n=1 Tax=Mycolicibacterium mucogenicum DSM 44124 TaxID=1226753 RepID=A0A8H2PIB1_MYCMU|nr:GntR family transcriptional regulator [Mycolicibacterium mucogenicum]KAB7752789.1 GntR family transcriptional regulator [Mycolicibacterium mucogenicum DSM 44124]QPG69131.1 FadR family transcriptional regulator [Mycolicibacterium mucogenicum DSM 44124]